MAPLDDRLKRLDRRAAAFFRLDEKGLGPNHRAAMSSAWTEARNLVVLHDPAADSEVTRLDMLLSLFERIAASSTRLDEAGEWFDLLERCIADAVLFARACGGHPGIDPLLGIEPVRSPLYADPGAPGVLTGKGTSVPLPLVVCPALMLEEPWTWVGLFHEVGHQIDSEAEDTSALQQQLEDLVPSHLTDAQSSVWYDWVGECVADVYAALLGGADAAECLISLLKPSDPGDAIHPPTALRTTVLQGVLATLADPAWALPLEETPGTKLVISLLVRRFESFWRDLRQQPEVDGAPRLVPARVGKLFQASSDPEKARDIAREMLRDAPVPAWQLTEAGRKILTEAVRIQVATEVDSRREGLKLPPLELARLHDSIDFIGGSHGQLLSMLRQARALRASPWKRIYIFALDDGPLSRVLADQKTGKALVEERDRSLQGLRDFLSVHAERWKILIYQDPYVFASFWSMREGEASATPHLHPSHSLWNRDLRRARGWDYKARDSVLPPWMREHVAALLELEKGVRVWAEGGVTP